MTVGEDEQIASQPPAVCLKIFDLDKMEPEGTSTSSPDCIQILRVFTNQFPEAKVYISIYEVSSFPSTRVPFILLRIIQL